LVSDPRWWSGDPRERFWLEATDRPDVGADLKAPTANVRGDEEWRYCLFREAAIGDLVFHYDSKADGITSISRIAGPPVSKPIIWAARGTYARERGAKPEEVPGYVVPLDNHRALISPLTLEQLRKAQPWLRDIVSHLERIYRRPLYFPFELADRPARLMQGYSFKLPADFVAGFETLASAAGAMLLPPQKKGPVYVPDGNASLVRRAVAAIEAATEGYEIGGLQELRKTLRGRARRAGRTIFGAKSVSDEFAFHLGGRDELQFNIGLDEYANGQPALRYGVAFSLEPSQALPDWRVLVPRIRRFNDYMRDQPEFFGDLSMWHFDSGGRSQDRGPGPIDPEIVSGGNFVFLGARQSLDTVDIHECLRLFDRLLPLYLYVQDKPAVPAAFEKVVGPDSHHFGGGPAHDVLRLEAGVEQKTTGWIAANQQARILNVFLRHNEIQNRLKIKLKEEGLALVTLEAKIGQRSIDLVSKHGEDLWFWEIKTAGSVRQCLREAIGQLLEYAFWPGATQPAKVVVVGEQPPTTESATYVAKLNEHLPVQLEYRQFQLID
jgi:hypothetical protein